VIAVLQRLFEAFFPFPRQDSISPRGRSAVPDSGADWLDEGEELSDQIFAARCTRIPKRPATASAASLREDAVIRLFERLPEIRRLLISDEERLRDGRPGRERRRQSRSSVSYRGLTVRSRPAAVAHELESSTCPCCRASWASAAPRQTRWTSTGGERSGERFFIDPRHRGVVIGETSDHLGKREALPASRWAAQHFRRRSGGN